MAKTGRNDPCPCGSGKKYKHCHGPIDAERATELRRLKQAQDTLLVKIMDAAPRFSGELADGMQRFWNGKHTVEAIEDLDDIEERGSERFLTWFMFDYRGDGGRTPVERLVEDAEELELTPAEASLLPGWTDVRLQPYAVLGTEKGQGITVRPLWEERELQVEDQAAARRLEEGEVLIVHLTPGADAYYVAGAGAQLTPDTVERLHEWADLHLEDLRRATPEATYADLIRERSEIFNHFVMALPREEKAASQVTDRLQAMIDNVRVAMSMTAASLGLQREPDEPERRTFVQLSADDAEPSPDIDPEPSSEDAGTAESDQETEVTPTDVVERPIHTTGH